MTAAAVSYALPAIAAKGATYGLVNSAGASATTAKGLACAAGKAEATTRALQCAPACAAAATEYVQNGCSQKSPNRLVQFKTPHHMMSCDYCGDRCPTGYRMWGNRQTNFDVCLDCVENLARKGQCPLRHKLSKVR